MAQYQIYTEGVYVSYTDGIDTFRDGVRNGNFVTDRVIGPYAFQGVENEDWECVDSRSFSGGYPVFRDGSRSGHYVLDQALNSTGFNGTQSTDEGLTGDWINLELI